MITAYVGLPGSGKSYGVVENVIVPALIAGREVWTNIPVHEQAMIQHTGSTVTPFDLSDVLSNPRWFLDVLPKGVICVLDEAWRLWPSGLKASAIQAPHKEYMAEIRHLVNDAGFSSQLVIVTQDLAQLASFARTLIETTFRAAKLKAIGSNKRFRVDVYQGAVTGHSPPQSKLLRQMFYSYRPEIFALYKSHTKSDAGAGNEKSIDGRGTIFGNLTFKSLPVLFIGACLLLWYAFGELKKMYNVGDDDQSAPLAVPATQPQFRPPPPRNDDFFKGRQTWISLNMGKGGSTIYRFVSTMGESHVDFDVHQVRKLGYQVVMVNECLVFFERSGSRQPVTCRAQRERRGGLISGLVAGNTGTDGANERSD